MSEVKILCGQLPIIQRFCLRKEKSVLKYKPCACESVKLHEAIKKEKKRKGKEKERAVC